MNSATDVVQLTSFVSDLDIFAVYGLHALAWKVVTVGGGTLVVRTRGAPDEDRTLTVAAGDSLDIQITHVLTGTTVAALQLALGTL